MSPCFTRRKSLLWSIVGIVGLFTGCGGGNPSGMPSAEELKGPISQPPAPSGPSVDQIIKETPKGSPTLTGPRVAK